MGKLINHRKGPEAIIQEAIVKKLRYLEWLIRETHGNMYQTGFPDIYAAHRKYGQRWIEVKDPKRKGDIFTPAQHEFFPQLHAAGVGVWILVGDSDSEIEKLFKAPNWWQFLHVMQ
jgi:hypothetical protein